MQPYPKSCVVASLHTLVQLVRATPTLPLCVWPRAVALLLVYERAIQLGTFVYLCLLVSIVRILLTFLLFSLHPPFAFLLSLFSSIYAGSEIQHVFTFSIPSVFSFSLPTWFLLVFK